MTLRAFRVGYEGSFGDSPSHPNGPALYVHRAVGPCIHKSCCQRTTEDSIRLIRGLDVGFANLADRLPFKSMYLGCAETILLMAWCC